MCCRDAVCQLLIAEVGELVAWSVPDTDLDEVIHFVRVGTFDALGFKHVLDFVQQLSALFFYVLWVC